MPPVKGWAERRPLPGGAGVPPAVKANVKADVEADVDGVDGVDRVDEVDSSSLVHHVHSVHVPRNLLNRAFCAFSTDASSAPISVLCGLEILLRCP